MGSCIVCRICSPEKLIYYIGTGEGKEEIMTRLGSFWSIHLNNEHPEHPLVKKMRAFAAEIHSEMLASVDVRTGTPDDYKSEVDHDAK